MSNSDEQSNMNKDNMTAIEQEQVSAANPSVGVTDINNDKSDLAKKGMKKPMIIRDLLSEATKSIEDAIDVIGSETTISSTDWMPVQVAEIPLTSTHPLNIALNKGANESAKEEGTTKVLKAITATGSGSTTIKAITKPIQMALVPAPHGNMIAVPIAALNDPTKLQHLKTKTSKSGTLLTLPVPSSSSAIKGKTSLFQCHPVTSVKVLPAQLITSVSSSSISNPNVTVSTTISISSTQPLNANSKPTTASTITSGVTPAVPITISSVAQSKLETKMTSHDASTSKQVSPSNSELVNNDITSPPPLLTEKSSFFNNVNNLDLDLAPPTLTPVINIDNDNDDNDDDNDDDDDSDDDDDDDNDDDDDDNDDDDDDDDEQENSSSKETAKPQVNFINIEGSAKYISLEYLKSISDIVTWKDGLCTLPNSELRLKLVKDSDVAEIITEEEYNQLKELKQKEREERKMRGEYSDDEESNVNANANANETKTCVNCGQQGPADTFIRQGKFCSKACAIIQANQLQKMICSKNEAKEPQKRRSQTSKKHDSMKMRKLGIEMMEKSMELELLVKEPETENDEISSSNCDPPTTTATTTKFSRRKGDFNWREYLNKTNGTAAHVKCFKEHQLFPTSKNLFKPGMKLEGIDPEHPSKFCVLTVAEVLGYRLRLHFDGYKDIFDFWVNADSPFIFPCGWCEKNHRRLQPPGGYQLGYKFDWSTYLQTTKSSAAPKQLFTISSKDQTTKLQMNFRIGMKLEAVDKSSEDGSICVATIADIIDNWLLIHFDGWESTYDYWVESTSPYIHPINWCRSKNKVLTPPKDYHKQNFVWEDYLAETNSFAVYSRSLRIRPSNFFKVGMRLEAVDKRNPKLVRPATIVQRLSHSIKINFDGWKSDYDYWVDDDSPDIHPINWCFKTNHLLQPPPSSIHQVKKADKVVCPIPCCNGVGNMKGPRFSAHHSILDCPYANPQQEPELPDRLKEPDNIDDNGFDSLNSQCSPSTSESNSFPIKRPKLRGGSRKRKHFRVSNVMETLNVDTSMPHCNGSVTSSSNSESPKQSRPSTPSSCTNISTYHSIYALQEQIKENDAPILWAKHSKNILSDVESIKGSEVQSWDSTKVAEFVDKIRNCQGVGQIFLEEQVDGKAFLLLNQNDMVKHMKIKLGPAIKIYNTILMIRNDPLEGLRSNQQN